MLISYHIKYWYHDIILDCLVSICYIFFSHILKSNYEIAGYKTVGN